jgi:enterochelin esterase family protein
MTDPIESLRRSGTPVPAEIEAFIAGHRFPIVDPRGATFVYHGAADSVALRCWIHGLPATQPFERLGDSDLWMLRIELPERSRIEYKLVLVADGEETWILDPLNPLTASDPFGANSVFRGHGYRRPEWSLPDALARPGAIDAIEVASEAFGESRRILLYLPARFRRTRRYPLLVVHDGEDYLRFAALQTVLDNLIHRLEIPPMLVALTQSPDRLREYGADDRHARFAAVELPQALARGWPLQDGPAARGLLGASFGAVAALHAAWRHPGRVGRLVLQSGSFAFSDIGHHRRTPVFDPVARFVNEFRARPGRPAERIHLSCGIYESLIYENRSLVPLLRDTGIELRYEEVRDGHNWENWRDRLQAALTWLFPGPLWMVYE